MIIGTAGHIDHGKSALVEALTGRSMDPLVEERRRGITIDLHFAALALPGGGVAGVVDVPGHEDLVRTMVAGASGIDLVLLVIAADEGVMPQTREHLAVVEQLRIPRGIPVITKSDLITPDRVTALEAEITDWLRSSPVAFAAPVSTSVRTTAGLDALRSEISDRAAKPPSRRAADLARLPIDRAFTLPGVGPVVTGTAWSGMFRVGDAVLVLPTGNRARVRSLGRHGQDVAESAPGDRIAVALAGLDLSQLRRGQVLVHAGIPWESTRALDALIELLPAAPRPIVHLSRVRVHLGTIEVIARVHPRQTITPGEQTLARLVLDVPTVARGGDRLVLRSYSPVQVIGGGWVVDPLPPPGKPLWTEGLSSEDPANRLGALLERRPNGVAEAMVPILLGTPPAGGRPVESLQVERVEATLVPRSRLEQGEEAALAAVRAYQVANPSESGIPRETLRQSLARFGLAGEAAVLRLVARGALVVEAAITRESGFSPTVPGGEAAIDRVVRAVSSAGLAPPSSKELEADLQVSGIGEALRVAARTGRIVPIGGDRYSSRNALTEFTTVLASVAARGPITPGALRDATGLSRKFLIPLLEWADQAGLTIRRGAARVPGPRLARESGPVT